MCVYVCVCVNVCVCQGIPNKDYKDGRTWLGKSYLPDYSLVGMTQEVSSERLPETPDMTLCHVRTWIPRR